MDPPIFCLYTQNKKNRKLIQFFLCYVGIVYLHTHKAEDDTNN